jgi:endonuclease/exonuclease/phosphatase family metal-dependent hydrolase
VKSVRLRTLAVEGPRHPKAPPRAGAIRLLTWNIHRGRGGVDGRYDPWRTAVVIQHHDPDLVLLQEVAEGVPRARRDRQTEMLGEALGYPHCVFSPEVSLRRGRWGNAILSRYPIARTAHVGLTFLVKKRRGAIIADVVIRAGGERHILHVVNVHLGLSGVERRWQIRRLLAAPHLAALGPRSRIVLAGDLNDWAGALARRRGALRGAGFLAARGRHHAAMRTFPARFPLAQLDRVFLAGAVACRAAYRSRFGLARHASDHLPIVVDLDLRHA